METLQDFVDYADTNIDMDKTVVVLKMFDPTIHDAGCKYLVEYTIGNISDENLRYINAFSYEIVAIRVNGSWMYSKTDKKYFSKFASFCRCIYCATDMIHLNNGNCWARHNLCFMCYMKNFDDLIKNRAKEKQMAIFILALIWLNVAILATAIIQKLFQ